VDVVKYARQDQQVAAAVGAILIEVFCVPDTLTGPNPGGDIRNHTSHLIAVKQSSIQLVMIALVAAHA